jgi:hypothetical protein
MVGAKVIKLGVKETNFLRYLMWLENTTYLNTVFVLDIDFETYGVTLYGNPDVVESFRQDIRESVDYIENTDKECY